ncbi:glycosyltransferase family 9 protein [Oceanibaculum sp.]|uniref:glycosyltransferase family 9 protein n=1 Tax=Oceanibaculum sp. TaxID=1903597 RepID=UPI00258A9F9D|nr:glycosyltransferase family 9 protein [Oceanibaculum sp.]MCH2395553.1 glycosyltransferase family 9 protein [Oceanibaculum sp.]
MPDHTATPPASRRILVIKHGAFGDFIMALGAFQALRRHHAGDHLVLQTIPSLVPLARASGWFDEVWTDPRDKGPGALLAIRRQIKGGRFDLVYDLQCSDRTNLYFQLLRPFPPRWSGTAWGCSDPDPNPNRNATHGTDRYAMQLATMGIAEVPPPDAGWITADVSRFALPDRYVLLAPGCAPHRPEKRWPEAQYADLANRLVARGIIPVLVGTKSEAETTAAIAAACPQAIDLTDQTTLFELGGIARAAAGAVGNDTGPMHLLAVVGCPSVVLYSHASTPTQSGQRGPKVTILREPQLKDLPVERVEAALLELMDDLPSPSSG